MHAAAWLRSNSSRPERKCLQSGESSSSRGLLRVCCQQQHWLHAHCLCVALLYSLHRRLVRAAAPACGCYFCCCAETIHLMLPSASGSSSSSTQLNWQYKAADAMQPNDTCDGLSSVLYDGGCGCGSFNNTS